MADLSLRIAWPVLFFSLTLPAHGAEPYFTNVTREAGINFINQAGNSDKKHLIETQAAGGGFCDFDQDGRLDLYLTGGVRADSAESTAFYRNLGHGVYANETGRSDTGLYGWNMGMACADYDADGDPDLYVTRWGPDVLLANGSDGVFTDVTATANLGSEGWGTGAAFADYDRDGDLDGYLLTYQALKNKLSRAWLAEVEPPSNTVKTVSQMRLVPPTGQQMAGGMIPRSYREKYAIGQSYDGQTVFLMVGQRDVLFRNNGDGSFTDVTAEA